jgi:GNAT superfamily N-acetyltransferase
MGRNDRLTSARQARSQGRQRAGKAVPRTVRASAALRTPASARRVRRGPAGEPSSHPAAELGPIRQGTAGDHHASLDFLASVFHAPSPEAFWSWLEDPRYEPRDRLIVRHRGLVVAHVLLVHRTWSCGSAVLPATTLAWLGCLPEYRGNGLESRLLAEALRRAAAEGSVLAVSSLRHLGTAPLEAWACCGAPQAPWVCARDLMALLAACDPGAASDEAPPPVYVRPWRHIELASLLRLYDQHRQHATGASVRDEPAWQWILSRRRHGHILVAADGQSRRDHGSEVLGYVVVRDNIILEAAVLPQRPDAALHLLGRVCRDAVEQGHAAIRLDAVSAHWLAALRHTSLAHAAARNVLDRVAAIHPAAAPRSGASPDRAGDLVAGVGVPPARLHADAARVRTAAARHRAVSAALSPEHAPDVAAASADVCFLQLLHPARAVRALAPELAARAQQAGLRFPLELGWQVAGRQRYLLRVSRQAATLRADRLGRSYLSCDAATWVRLLLGVVGVDEAMQCGAVRPSTRQAAQVAAILFPRRLLWRPLLDDPAL